MNTEKLKNLFLLFVTFLKIGAFTFGGGYAMIPLIEKEVVDKRKWITDEDILEIVAIAESTPGPIAINLATFVGYKRKGVTGSIAATLGVVLPSFIILYIISLFLDSFMENKYVAYAFSGIKCAVAFLILKAGIDLFMKLPKKIIPMTAFSLVFIAMIIFDILSVSFSSIIFIILGGLSGIILYSKGFEKEGKR
jgi:chromate transporter